MSRNLLKTSLKCCLRASVTLYPAAWRVRYGVEFESLTGEVEPQWSDVFDVLRGAMTMHARKLSSYMKLAGALALAGLVTAAVAGFAVPGPYVSSAIIRVQPLPDENAVDPQMPDRLNLAWQEVTSRGSLSEIIQRPELQLYHDERNRKPFEDVIARMKSDLKIERLDAGMLQYRVSFSYPDRTKAKFVADALTAKLQERFVKSKGTVEIPQEATLPDVAQAPDRMKFLAWGLGLGSLLGVLVAFLRWRAKWTLKVLGFGFAGYVAMMFALYYRVLPRSYTSNATMLVLPAGPFGGQRLSTDSEMASWLQDSSEKALNDGSLSELVRRPGLDLYPGELERMSMNSVIAKVRKNLSIEILPSRSAIRVLFTYPDPFKAQRVVSAVLEKLSDQSPNHALILGRFRAFAAASKSVHWSKDGTILGCSAGDHYDFECVHNYLAWLASERGHPKPADLLEAPSLPLHVTPDPAVVGLTGLSLGLLWGVYVLRKRRPVIV